MDSKSLVGKTVIWHGALEDEENEDIADFFLFSDNTVLKDSTDGGLTEVEHGIDVLRQLTAKALPQAKKILDLDVALQKIPNEPPTQGPLGDNT